MSTVSNPLVGLTDSLPLSWAREIGTFDDDSAGTLEQVKYVTAEALRSFPSEAECVRAIAYARYAPSEYALEEQAYALLLLGDERGFSEVLADPRLLTPSQWATPERREKERRKAERVAEIVGSTRAEALSLLAQWRNATVVRLRENGLLGELQPVSSTVDDLVRLSSGS